MADDKFPSHKLDRYIVRLPDGMRELIAEAAAKAGRSMNAEIVHRLQQSFFSAEQHENMNKQMLQAMAIIAKYEALNAIAKRTPTQEREYQAVAAERNEFFHEIVESPLSGRPSKKPKKAL